MVNRVANGPISRLFGTERKFKKSASTGVVVHHGEVLGSFTITENSPDTATGQCDGGGSTVIDLQ